MTETPLRVRTADAADATRCLEIYAPSVRDTATSFELEVPTVTEMARRIEMANRQHCWLVAELTGRVVGYAYGGKLRTREAYRYAAEVSVYVAAETRRGGVAGGLYTALFERLDALGYCQLYAGITLPNGPSVALHERCGFSAVGRFPNAGFKFGRWHDIGWWHRELRSAPLHR
ncbi:MAG: N-acetyltransferase family protein [Pseudomonadota bacterium]